ncbi:RNA polymerase sigma factor [Marivirga atlantica]|uniref:RNA polymerase sigma factor n=1 Tax=Marivirga atlantica TaxID=1548457 RepID=A0A937A5N2_9BACT|nr:RNA polymerase sigma factor [Marivirga atlantica]MBL0764107.1 RNA polymerase sigma factor [Marivirga atlantica]
MEDLISYTEHLVNQEQEKSLIEEAKNNPQRFKPLYEKYYERIYKFLLKRHTNLDIAESLTSDTFFKAITKLKKFKQKGAPFSAWLYRIALNESNMYFRKQKKKQTLLLNEDVVQSLSEEIKLTEHVDDFKPVEHAFKKIKKHELELLQLRFYESLSFKEIGQILAITENNAKVRCYRILDKIRIAIEES